MQTFVDLINTDQSTNIGYQDKSMIVNATQCEKTQTVIVTQKTSLADFRERCHVNVWDRQKNVKSLS